ncbi:MAG: response regulator transcription factor [Dehalococcoidia bacterium]|nr:response regulator transcription factor [Dehalococcoidia bacterium]
MKILIVDDSEIVRKRLKAMLSDITELENISQAEDLPEAISSFQKLNPEVVVLDIRMPGGSGIDVLRETKKGDQPPVVIVLTNYPYPQYRKKCMDAGADFFFDKSTEFDQMMAVLRRLGENRDADNTTSLRSRDDKIDSKKKVTRANEVSDHIQKQIHDSTGGRAKFD